MPRHDGDSDAIALPRRRDYFARYWRGKIRLPVSFWANAVPLGILAAGALAASARLDIPEYPFARACAFTGFFLILTAASAWLLIGLWRSASEVIAERQKRGRFAVWAELSRLLGVLGFGALVGTGGALMLPRAWNSLPALSQIGNGIADLLPQFPAQTVPVPTIETAQPVAQAPMTWANPAPRPGFRPVTPEAVDEALQEIPSFATLKRWAPDRYARVVGRIVSGSRQGKNPSDVLADASRPMRAAIARYRSLAGDDVQVRLARLLAEEARLLASDHPAECVAMLSGGEPPSPAPPAAPDKRPTTVSVPIRDSGGWAPPFAASLLPPEVRGRDVEIAAEIIDGGAAASSDVVASDSDARTEISEAWARVQARTGLDPGQFEQAPVAVEKQRTSCLLMSAFFEELAALPPERAGALMRYLNR